MEQQDRTDHKGTDHKGTDQREAWDSFYKGQKRPWRGVAELDVPFTEGQRILDIGCGNGKTSQALIKMGCDVIGVDFSQNAVDHCNSSIKGMTAICSSSDRLPFSDNEFDGVVLVHVLEHLDDTELKNTVNEIQRVLKSNGYVFLRVFEKNDMRSNGGTEIKGNGIRYRYYDTGEIETIFEGFDSQWRSVTEQTTKFGSVRMRIEALYKKK